MVVNLSFLDQSRYFFIQVAPQLSSRGWVDPIPDPLLLRKFGRDRNRTQDLWICSQKLWPLDHRGGLEKTINLPKFFQWFVECEKQSRPRIVELWICDIFWCIEKYFKQSSFLSCILKYMIEGSCVLVIKKCMYDLTEQFISLGAAEVTYNGNSIPSILLKIVYSTWFIIHKIWF
jgi:hypothetical protein